MNKTPKLRFKEFSGDWEQKKLGDECNFFSGGTPLTTNRSYYDGNIPFIRSAELSEYTTELKISQDGLNNSSAKLVQKGDLLYALYGATSGAVSISKIDGAINQAILCIKSDNINLEFLEKILIKNKENIIKTYLQGGQGNLSSNIIKGLKYNLPSKEEQEKIASFLSLIDDKISLQGEKVEALKDYKKGMMQKIFSRELRFKDDDGRDYPEWEEKKLGDITDIGTGSNDLQDKVDGGKYPFFVRSSNVERINSYTFDGEAILIPGDGNIGQIYHYINGKFAYHQRVYKISDFIDGVSGKYIYYYMSRFFLKEALKNSVKATVDSLRLPTLTGMKILLPCIEEQKKITKLLKELDNKIEKEQVKLDYLNEYKKGLLQQMFV